MKHLMTLTALPTSSSPERSRLLALNLIRERTLERLYERRAAVDDLIRSLEEYQRANEPRKAECAELSAERTKCWSGFSQSQN